MLRLLLDEQISRDVAEGLRKRQKNLVVSSLAEWDGGKFMAANDSALLAEAAVRKFTLVTFDLRTIPPLLKEWAETGRNHAGVVFVDQKTIPTSDFGGLIRALHNTHQECQKWDWTNRIVYLRR